MSSPLSTACRLALFALLAGSASGCAFMKWLDTPIDPRQQQAAAARVAADCQGIEMMGLYKNEIFNRAMGGGVVEWLAKVRNNTGVTRIVAFGWRDAYGQEKRSQVQLRGGDIASPRVDMTQARMIPPVSDLRLLNCQ